MGQVESGERDFGGSEADGQASWRYETKDLVTASQAHCLGRMLGWQNLVSRVLGLGAFGLALSLVTGAPFVGLMPAILFGPGVMLVVQMISIVVWVPYRASRNFAQQRNLHGQVRASWDSKGLRLTTDELDSRTPWAHVLLWREDANNVRLYHSDALFAIAPKRANTDHALSELRVAAAAAGVSGASNV